MTDKRTNMPLTTASQRCLLCETREATHDVARACRRAQIGRRTFYYWKARVSAGGYEALAHVASRVPKHL